MQGVRNEENCAKKRDDRSRNQMEITPRTASSCFAENGCECRSGRCESERNVRRREPRLSIIGEPTEWRACARSLTSDHFFFSLIPLNSACYLVHQPLTFSFFCFAFFSLVFFSFFFHFFFIFFHFFFFFSFVSSSKNINLLMYSTQSPVRRRKRSNELRYTSCAGAVQDENRPRTTTRHDHVSTFRRFVVSSFRVSVSSSSTTFQLAGIFNYTPTDCWQSRLQLVTYWQERLDK